MAISNLISTWRRTRDASRRRTLRQVVSDEIRHMIIAGEFAPGRAPAGN